ncbi:uncharacterized protein PFL1_02974 [Pseudozyma flocculosa PF-1]|uniref:Uncharacterized protein n=2 Tax=Pseudozyma flocculosa TaxID=84751 RepID=A0A5C3F3S9_9BASI|nr:uncharacterized protein PFL1_02974 [Pseudozyma flocculosa PF-1]EPQ29755.1 hypothetical protein PFL1_02974 [Pseudozyma flocculosa PF-1]SPO38337.1 uncharacterized protein PSFLO_03814 [Pseudozyma flocculosa]
MSLHSRTATLAATAARSVLRSTAGPRQAMVLPLPPVERLRLLSSSSPLRNSPKPATNTDPSDISTPGFQPRPSSSSSSSSSSPPPGPGLTPRVGTVFISLTLFGVVVTAYGLYEYYTSFSTWPKELRDDLRAALKSRNRGDARRAESFFRKALDNARSLKQQGKLGTGSDVLKTTGIAIALASLLEDEGQLVAAYLVYQDALDEVRQEGAFDPILQARQDGEAGKVRIRSSKKKDRTPEERMRAVAIAQRMGDLAQIDEVLAAVIDLEEAAAPAGAAAGAGGAAGRRAPPPITGTVESPDPAERNLVWSVEEMLRLALPEEVRQKALDAAAAGSKEATGVVDLAGGGAAGRISDEDKVLIADLKLPPWVTQHEIGAAMEALGSFYATRGKAEYAVPLYLQALSILMPPPPSSSSAAGTRKQATVADRCRAAVLMNNLSQLFVETGLDARAHSASDLVQAKSWASKGLEISDITIRKAGFDGPPPSSSSIKTVEETSEERTRQVRMECLRVQITLLFNLGVMSEMTGDVCDARKYYQRAFQQAQVADLEVAKTKAAAALAKLERRSGSAKAAVA